VTARPGVAVIVPFRGDAEAARGLLGALSALWLGSDDELIVADNSGEGVVERVAPAGARVVRAALERSSYHARNAGAAAAAPEVEWLLFIDADCVPDPGLVDAYFASPIPPRCALVGGEILPDESQGALLARYARSRNFLSQTEGLHGKAGVAAATANLLVRRRAFDRVGGFAEGIRSGGDIDLCWRLCDAGWTLAYRPRARVVHRHRETLAGFLGQIARYGAGARWLNRRHPGSSPRWPLVPGLVGSARDVVANVARGRIDEATYRAIDGLGLIAHNIGYGLSNATLPVQNG
jgi:GT2 family glycosyltransferase